MYKNKTLATYITLFLGIFGLHILYLNKAKKYFFLHLIATFIGGLGVFILYTTDINTPKSLIVWFLLIIFMLNWNIIWLTSIYYGLMSAEKWLIFTNHKSGEQNYNLIAQTNAMTVICVIIALLIGMGTLMAFLAFAFQSYFEATL